MNTGKEIMPAAGRDRVVTIAMMLVRLGAVVAIVLGLGRMAGLWSFASLGGVHILAGALVLLGALVAGIRMMSLGKGAVMLLGGVVIGMAGAAVALRGMSGVFHLLLMVAAVGMAEANAAKLKR